MKEKLEIGVGLKQRPLSNVELNAKNTVDLYAKASQETRSMFSEMKKECFNVTQHANYEQYTQIRELRNDLAKEILSIYPLHREFVNQASKDFFISKKSMERQVNYGNALKEEHIKEQEMKLRARDLVSELASSTDMRGVLNREVSSGISKENSFLQDIAKMNIPKPESKLDKFIVDTKEFIKSQQERVLYSRVIDHHKKTEGYGLYITNAMLDNYINTNGLNIDTKEYINEYASMLVQKAIDENSIKEVSPELIESSLKQAVCFEALKNASIGNAELTPKSVNDLHSKAQMLSEKLGEDNIRVLNNKELMKEANSIIPIDSSIQSLSSARTEQVINANDKELAYERNKEMSQAKELEKSKEFELSM